MKGDDTYIRVRWELGRPEQDIILRRESEGLIVVLKRSNVRGAKGPQRNVFLLMRGDPLEREFDYGELEFHLSYVAAGLSSDYFFFGTVTGQQAKQQPSDVSFINDANVQLSVNALR